MEAVVRSPAASLFTAYSWKGEAHDAKEIVLMIENWSKVLLFRSSCPLKLVLLKSYSSSFCFCFVFLVLGPFFTILLVVNVIVWCEILV
uniref:Uncharacterized protein n=1 Tax=Solanum tuberosum TaxID=4113 RepID=M1D3U3_SOLTU